MTIGVVPAVGFRSSAGEVGAVGPPLSCSFNFPRQGQTCTEKEISGEDAATLA